ncbi:MAG TPA: CusA/CzcA family heavy metal efflux RND transporter [Oscillatoriaceae cyanobacterium]
MIERIIEFSIKQRLWIILATLALVVWGIFAIMRTPLDAIPDLSDNQVIVYAEWPGRSPQVIEDQVTYPLERDLQGLPGVKAVRASSAFGYAMVNVIFNDDTDVYWARTRVLERLSTIRAALPAGVVPTLGPDGTGVGQVFWYTVEGDGYDLGRLRAIQDWYLKLQLQSVPGVAEVASVGGFVRQYQVDVNPERLRGYGVRLADVVKAVTASNNEVGGNEIELNGSAYAIRGLGYLRGIHDLERVPVKAGRDGVPITVGQVATVQMGSETRQGVLDKNGQGEVVGGIVVMRDGENARAVIARVKAKLAELKRGLPLGVHIETAYDRSELIDRAVDTLKHALIEEAIVVSVVVFLFLLHFRSALVIVLTIPVAVLAAFVAMYHLGISSNIMSLGGVAIAIGVLVDAGIVMVENAYRRLAERSGTERLSAPERLATILASAKQVGRPIFFSLAIIVLAFAPIFLLTGQEGKLFHPLAATKTFAMVAAAVLSITLVPVLMTFLLRGRLRPERENPIARFFQGLYEPVLRLALRFKWPTLALSVLILLLSLPVARSIGTEFMPPLDEGSILYMPITAPNVSITEAKRELQVEDKILASFPEVALVLGKAGRAETATDPAPLNMVETIVLLKPKSRWPAGMTKDDLIARMDARLQIPGVSNVWTQPIINRIDMLATGVRTDLGLKIYGNDLDTLDRLAAQAERLLRAVPGAADVAVDRQNGGRYVDISLDRDAAARYGIDLGEAQEVIETAMGGENLTTTVEGRARFPVRVRYARDFRDSLGALENVYVTASNGTPIPFGEIARFRVTEGPPMINSENALLRSIVYANVHGRDTNGFIQEANAKLARELKLPAGYYYAWSGQYENQLHAKQRLMVVVPLVLAIIFLLLFATFGSIASAAMIMLSVPFALVGGVWLQKLSGFNFSVAVWVGYIALAGIAVETGVVMLIYLNEALDRRLAEGRVDAQGIVEAAIEGASLRLRPKLMTVAAALSGLVPLMWATGTGSDVMRPLATPMVGGLATSLLLVLIVIPVLFVEQKRFALRHGRLARSDLGHAPVEQPLVSSG